MRICDDELVKLDYVNGELGLARRLRYARHLAHCPTCARAVEELATISSLVRAIPQPRVSPDLIAHTTQSLAAVQPGTKVAPREIGWFLEAWEQPRVVAAGALAAAGVTGLVITHLNGTLKALLATVSTLDVWALLVGVPSQPDSTILVPLGAVLLIAALVSVPSLIDNAIGLSLHRAVVRSCAQGSNGSADALRRRI
ncbi:MAG: hypothetical protein MUE60_06640 [Candidatus Eisenbacteria bacterium]|jgi:anti-sigma factor RsiW|nr:hypothetical protein [Candidatus Eisenbacteria bacterium]